MVGKKEFAEFTIFLVVLFCLASKNLSEVTPSPSSSNNTCPISINASSPDKAWESLKEEADKIGEKLEEIIDECADVIKKTIFGVIKIFKLLGDLLKDSKPKKVGSAIAQALKWNTTDVIDWLAYYDDNMDMVMFLADIKALVNNASKPSVNFNKTVQEFVSAVENGSLVLQVDGKNVSIKSLALCSDIPCDNAPTTLATSNKPTTNPVHGDGAILISTGTRGLCGVIVCIMFIDKLFF